MATLIAIGYPEEATAANIVNHGTDELQFHNIIAWV